eukprot:UN18775
MFVMNMRIVILIDCTYHTHLLQRNISHHNSISWDDGILKFIFVNFALSIVNTRLSLFSAYLKI